MEGLVSTAALWWAVVGAGVYHGANPGMGWPLAVSAALMERRKAALWKALAALALGHFLAMCAILLPFSMMTLLVTWETQIRIGAGLLVIGLGVYLLINRRHPRILSRVPPHRLALWSFLAAMAHGAGLMLVPIYLDLCGPGELDGGHQAMSNLMSVNFSLAVLVGLLHTAAMALTGAVIALGTYHWLGLKFLSKAWFNLDVVWALSLIAVGLFGVLSALA